MATGGIAPQDAGEDNKDYKAIVAIDFGTTYSGFAFCYTTDPTRIFLKNQWKGQTTSGHKTLTCLCVQKMGGKIKPKSFGHEALQDYEEYRNSEDGARGRLQLFRNFKMLLYESPERVNRMQLTSVDGTFKMDATDIFAMSLRIMRDHALAQMNLGRENKMETSDVRWVLTVPAIWNDAAKSFMRGAAKGAGLIEDRDSQQLLLALEPEAASIYCRSDDVSLIFGRGMNTNIPIGTRYLVIDAGGGTVDIAAHEVTENGNMKELYHPSGGDWGGNQVNTSFTNLIKDVLGEDFIEHFMANNAMTWIDLLEGFEAKKRIYKRDEPMAFDIPYSLAQACEEFHNDSLEYVIRDKAAMAQAEGEEVKVTCKDGKIILNPQCLTRFFDEAVDKVTNHVRELLWKPQMGDIKYMMLVGGFGQCSFLQEAIRYSFYDQTILVPQEASLAVLKGAVMFACRPKVIESRIACRTYVFEVLEDPDPNIPVNQQGPLNWAGLRKSVSTVVTKGEELAPDQTIERVYYPMTVRSHLGHLTMYAADKDLVTSPFDKDLVWIGGISINVPAHATLETPIPVHVHFGGTEIHVESQNAKTTVTYHPDRPAPSR